MSPEPAHVAEWRTFLDAVEVRGPIPIHFRIVQDATGLWVLQSWMHVDGRDGGEKIDIIIQNELPQPGDPVEKAAVIRQRVLGHYQHEALENIFIGGERRFDPHAARWHSSVVADWRFNR